MASDGCVGPRPACKLHRRPRASTWPGPASRTGPVVRPSLIHSVPDSMQKAARGCGREARSPASQKANGEGVSPTSRVVDHVGWVAHDRPVMRRTVEHRDLGPGPVGPTSVLVIKRVDLLQTCNVCRRGCLNKRTEALESGTSGCLESGTSGCPQTVVSASAFHAHRAHTLQRDRDRGVR